MKNCTVGDSWEKRGNENQVYQWQSGPSYFAVCSVREEHQMKLLR